MAFPSNPSDGDTYIRYGRTYEYEAALSMWKVKKSGIQLTELSDVDVTTTPPAAGETLVWSGTKFVPDEINLLSVYQSELPLTGNVAGQMAYVTDTSRLYIYTGAGWFNVALVNTNPSIIVGPDGSYAFATDGTPIVLTLEAQDPEELPITWSYTVTSGALGSTATVQQEGNVFTITPSTDKDDVGEFSITFTASDGVNLATAVSSFKLAFGAADQYYNNNYILLKSTSVLNNHTFVDESTNGHTITRYGDVYQISSSPYSPSGWAASFDGSGDYLTIPASNDFVFDDGDFTIEAWIYPTDSGTEQGIVNNWQIGGAFIFRLTNANKLQLSYRTTASVNKTSTDTVPENEWTHVAVVRNNNNIYFYINGVADSGGAQSETGTIVYYNGSPKDLKIGTSGDTGNLWNGWISDLRIVKGVAVYTSAFTPATEPLTAITNTSLLTCQNNRFIDNSTNNHTITSYGQCGTISVSPYVPSDQYDPTVHGGSASFDGSGDYLTADITPVSNLGATTYTIEGWVWINSSGSRALIGAANIKYYIQWSTSTFYIGDGSTNISASWIAPKNSWVHIAVSRDSGGTTRAFIDGTLLLTSSTVLQTGSLSYLEIGRKGSTAYIMDGYISNVRYVAGTALYTSDFTPPTQLLTAVSGTELLLNMSNAGIYDEMTKQHFQMVGDITTSTTQTKYNDTAIYFDGNGDRLVIPWETGQWLNQTFPYTVEFWFYPDYNYNRQYILGRNSGNFFNLKWDGSATKIEVDKQGVGIRITASETCALNAWHHVAMTYDGTNTTLWINGVNAGSVSETGGHSSADVTIGYYAATSTSSFRGYVEDFRWTQGVARYTANFTPPTDALGFENAE